jgi:hypothetical protein
MRALDRLGVPYVVVVEAQELKAYEAVIDPKRLLVLDPAYQRDYDAFDHLGDAKTKGSGPARNFIWDHAQALGHPRHWVIDDNIKAFYRFNRNLKVPVADGSIFRCMEDFCERYVNIAMAGPNYFMFASRKSKMPPVTLNTRIYSCNLIRTDGPYRWRCRYNEDTDLSLRMLKDGWCTVLFNAFLQEKMVTLSVKGGNTDELYEGGLANLAKSKMITAAHPDVSRVVKRFGRWHHHVDYRSFKANKLILRSGMEQSTGINNYGMRLKTVDQAKGAKTTEPARRSEDRSTIG